ncbi:MAG: ATP-binding protein, partial [Prevotella sp.]
MAYADYIKQIEIDSLWSGTKHILWTLDRKVNVLSGINGVGKSTILTNEITRAWSGMSTREYKDFKNLKK